LLGKAFVQTTAIETTRTKRMQPAENLQDAIFSASAPVLIGLMFRLAIFHPRKAFHETGNWPAHLQTH